MEKTARIKGLTEIIKSSIIEMFSRYQAQACNKQLQVLTKRSRSYLELDKYGNHWHMDDL